MKSWDLKSSRPMESSWSKDFKKDDMKYDSKIAGRYDSARRMPKGTMLLWLDAIANHIPGSGITTILDVGCGTGRFCEGLAGRFNARVIGIDPSSAMLSKARGNISSSSVEFREGHAECLPVADSSTCLIFMSMTYHHISDFSVAIGEFKRALRSPGFLCIRNSTKDLLNEVPYLKYFPTARELNNHRIPMQQELIDVVEGGGFSLLIHEVIKQIFAESLREYCEKISRRGLSDLVRIPDVEFEAGVQRMMDDIERNKVRGPIVEPIDLFIFKKVDE